MRARSWPAPEEPLQAKERVQEVSAQHLYGAGALTPTHAALIPRARWQGQTVPTVATLCCSSPGSAQPHSFLIPPRQKAVNNSGSLSSLLLTQLCSGTLAPERCLLLSKAPSPPSHHLPRSFSHPPASAVGFFFSLWHLGLNSGQTEPSPPSPPPSQDQPCASGPACRRLPASAGAGAGCRGSARPICSVKPLIDHLNYGRAQEPPPENRPRAAARALSRSKHPDARGGRSCLGSCCPKDKEEEEEEEGGRGARGGAVAGCQSREQETPWVLLEG